MGIPRSNILRLAAVCAACVLSGLSGAAMAASRGHRASGTMLTMEKTKLGNVAATTAGRAVYMFSLDSGAASKCSGKCSATWPAVTGSVRVANGSGLNPKLLGKNSHGQATYGGHPLYSYVRDSKGQTKGEGSSAFGGHWYLVGPRGTAVKPKKKYCKTLCQGY
jgi:predicted lipoprotein with Yx(FWY)xxD motif